MLKTYIYLGIESIDEINTAFTDNTKVNDDNETSTKTEDVNEMFEGKAILKIVRAKELEKKDVIGKSDPYVVINYKGKGFKFFCLNLILLYF